MFANLLSPSSSHTGFIASVDPGAARHQLQMSAGVVIVLAIAIAASLFAFRINRPVDVGYATPATSFAALRAVVAPDAGSQARGG